MPALRIPALLKTSPMVRAMPPIQATKKSTRETTPAVIPERALAQAAGWSPEPALTGAGAAWVAA